ncbi:MAG TPA: efflux RND transporter permease subunit [Cyclobacteriaceae bacterium]|nr:efflux RND transporter permease subunit [Cyclobacteriaceae bacterium]
MWARIADNIIRFRLPLTGLILVITVAMGYYASRVEMSYELNRTVPPEDPDMIFLNQFKKTFGEDGNMMAVGFRDSAIYKLENFRALTQLGKDIRKLDGVNEVVSLPRLRVILKDTAHQKFYSAPLFPEDISSQQQLDSLLKVSEGQRLYEGQLVNPKNGAILMLVSVEKEYANSALREKLTSGLLVIGNDFTQKTGIQVRYAGLPFMRSIVAQQVKKELSMFTILSAIVTGLIMLIFFRSVRAVIFSMIMIGVLVVWTLGTIALLGFKITLLSGLIPPVIVTIGITNAIYLLNKYHVEYDKHGNKIEAIRVVVQKMGLATFLTNLTVAIGFLTLLSTDITILREFGIVAGINIIGLFVVSLIMIPGILSWLPEPSSKHLRHLTFPILGGFVRGIDLLVHRHRAIIYSGATIITALSVVGILRLQSVSFMVDDIPEESQIKKDLKFFEANFSGVMPLGIEVDILSKRRRPLLEPNNLKEIDKFESSLDSIGVISRPLSIVSLVKAARQAFYNNNPARYDLPNSKSEAAFILRYIKGQSDSSGMSNKLLRSFVDSSFNRMCIKMQMADVGSKRMDSLVQFVIQPKADSLVAALKRNLRSDKDSVGVAITGTSKIFIKGNKFLINNLTESLVLAFLLITLSMAFLFANARMILISLIPNLIALMITAGIMGFMDIPLKASTALIFSITFGISVDNSIRFLAKYRQELLATRFFVPRAVSESILETGKSIIYTSVALFAGFIIFAFSDFGGTIALGILTSTTLVISMFTNLILLPALILTFDKPRKENSEKLPIDDFDATFYGEGEDEEIDLDKIKIHDRNGMSE